MPLLNKILLCLAALACCSCAQTGRYQMAVIPASPPFDDRLVILDTVTGEGKVLTNNYVRGFSFGRETLTELRKLKEEEASE